MLFRFLILIHVCAAFPLKCPDRAQWSFRARGHCPDPSKYSCLRNDLIGGYSENCTIFDFLQPGRKNVLRGGIDADICSSERYQPWPINFYTNVSTDCIFQKSTCNEEGQVIYGNGNRNTDITCRCDYTRGYDFIVKPRNPCVCVPSEEDCSCYLKFCQNSRYELSPDYGCIHSKKNISTTQCEAIIYGRIHRESNQSETEDIFQTRNISTAEKYITTAAIIVTSLSVVVIILSYSLAKIFANCYVEHNFFTKALTIYPSNPIEGNTISISCETKQKNISAIWKKDGRPIIFTDKIKYDISESKHTLKITNAEMSDKGVYCIDFKGVKREKVLQFEAYFSENISSNVETPEEGTDVTIVCEVVNHYGEQDVVQWFKDNQPVKITKQRFTKKKERRFSLVIKDCNTYDSGSYSIDVNGRKRILILYVKDKKYKVPLEIQNMKKADKERYIKILEEGNEKRYYIKIMILGRQGVGKTSLMKRLLQETTEGVQSTDGIDIVKKYKVDIKTGEWIFEEGENIEERIGRAIKHTDDSDKIDQPKKLTAQKRPNETFLKEATFSTEGGKTKIDMTDQDFKKKMKESRTKKNKQMPVAFKDNKWSSEHLQEISAHDIPNNEVIESTKRNDKLNMKDKPLLGGKSEVSQMAHDNKPKEQHTTVPKGTENIDILLAIGCNAKVPSSEYADCIIMDFAGHNEYYSTHQTFITKNAIYLVVFSLKDANPFTETVDETEKLSFWIDNIHCYAQQRHQDRQDPKDGGLSPPIIMVCTGLDTVDSKLLDNKKKELTEHCKKLLETNQRRSHLRGWINYISNVSQSEEAFNDLRKNIFEIAKNAKDMTNWGHDYPVRWIKLERALETQRNKGNNVIRFTDIMNVAKEEPVSIKSKEEVILFLKFQHEMGNLIFYDDKALRDYVVIKPTWLIDAFKCIISANEFKYDSICTHPDEINKFEEQGIISFDLCHKLFQEKSKEHADHSELVLQVMEKFDIIVEDTVANKSFICPSAIKNQSLSFEEICKNNKITKSEWSHSSWLCIEFDFLPPALYNHLLVLCMRDTMFEKPKLSQEIGIFCITGSNKLEKVFLCKSKNTILMQKTIIRSKLEDGRSSKQRNRNTPNGHDIFHNLFSKIEDMEKKYQITLKYHFSIQCGDVPYYSTEGRYTEDNIIQNSSGMCDYHTCNCPHDFGELFKFWIDRSTPALIPKAVINKPDDNNDNQENKCSKKCSFCKNMSVNKCYDCNKFFCEDCSRKHNDDDNYQSHLMKLISDSFILNLTLTLTGGILVYRLISDIKCLPNGDIVVAVYRKQKIRTFSFNGEQQHVIELEGGPWIMDVVDNNTIAVFMENKNVAIVDIQHIHVQYIRDIAIKYYVRSFICIERQFYAGDIFGFTIIDWSGDVNTRIDLSFSPCDMCYDADSQHIYCIDRDTREMVCIERDGTIKFIFADPNLTEPKSLTRDNKGNVLVLCENAGHSLGCVVKVDSNGESSDIVITNIPLSSRFIMDASNICFHCLTGSVVLGVDDRVYIYEKESMNI